MLELQIQILIPNFLTLSAASIRANGRTPPPARLLLVPDSPVRPA